MHRWWKMDVEMLQVLDQNLEGLLNRFPAPPHLFLLVRAAGWDQVKESIDHNGVSVSSLFLSSVWWTRSVRQNPWAGCRVSARVRPEKRLESCINWRRYFDLSAHRNAEGICSPFTFSSSLLLYLTVAAWTCHKVARYQVSILTTGKISPLAWL